MATTRSRCAEALRGATLRVVACAAMILAPAKAAAQEAARATAKVTSLEATLRAPFGASATAFRDSIVALARAQLGRKYVFGGETPDRGFDCSGLVRYLANALGIAVPRTAARQASAGEAVPKDTSQLRPGDLLTFGQGRRVSHVGIYIGEGRFIHASSAAGIVIESRLDRPPAPRIKPWRGVRRLVVTGDSAAVTVNSAS